MSFDPILVFAEFAYNKKFVNLLITKESVVCALSVKLRLNSRKSTTLIELTDAIMIVT